MVVHLFWGPWKEGRGEVNNKKRAEGREEGGGTGFTF